MLNVGDATLTFLGDTSQLDQVFARIPAQTEAAMGTAAGSVGQLGDAFGGVNFELDATASNVPYCGEVIKDVMESSSKVTHEAAAEAGLLGEAFGITLPRHVRSFLGEIPGISTALAAAFSATAVFFLIEAFTKVVEKIEELREHSHDMELAWDGFNTAILNSFNGLDDKLLEAGANLDNLRGNHLAALRKELELLDHASLRDLVSEFDLIAKSSDVLFAKLASSWYEFDAGSKGAKNALGDFKAEYDLLLAAGKGQEASDLLAGTLKSAKDALKTMEDQNAEQQKFASAQREAAAAAGEFAAGLQVAQVHGEGELKSQQLLITALEAQVRAQKTISEYTNDRKESKEIVEDNREEKAAEALAKKQEALYLDIAKAHDALNKSIDQRDNDLSKITTYRLSEEMKERDKAANEALKDVQLQERAAIAALDGEMKHSEEVTQEKILGYKKLLDLGILSGEQYLAKVKLLYDNEVQDIRVALEKKQQLVILEAQNQALQEGKILTAAHAKELKAYTDLENEKQTLTDKFTVRFAKDQDQVLKSSEKVFRTKANWDAFFKDLQSQALSTGQKFKLLANEITASIGQSVEAAVSGSDSFGAAMEKILKSALASLAGEAAVHVIKEIASAASDLATVGMEWHAGLHFAAAAKWAAVGAVAGVGGALIPDGSSGGGGTSAASSSASSTGSTASTLPAQQPGGGVANVPKLFSGAIVTQPTLAMIGDRQGGGSQTEGVFPLDDPRGRRALMEAFGMNGSGGSGDVHHNYYIQGMVSTSDLTKLSRVISRSANTGRVRMSVSNSARVTKRS